MVRTTDEWIGAGDDSKIPPRVRLRIFERDGGICQCGCGIKIRSGDIWQTDHIIAIVSGGENRETNLRTLLDEHHKEKTAADVAEKSKIATLAKKNLGIKKPSRMMGSKNSPFKKKMDGTVVRR